MPRADVPSTTLSSPKRYLVVGFEGGKFKGCPWRIFPGKAGGFQEQETLLMATGI